MRAIKRVAKDKEVPLQSVLETLVKQREWKHIRAAIHRVRDKQIYDYLREHVYTPEHFALLRLVLTLSKRSCALIHQSFKYRRLAVARRRGSDWRPIRSSGHHLSSALTTSSPSRRTPSTRRSRPR